MNLIYNVKDKPKFSQVLVFAFQQLLAIMAATIVVPVIVGNGMSQTAALFGAGVGTLVYLLFTKFRSPVFLGSSFAFLGPMAAAFAGAVSTAAGYVGLILGAIMAGLVYVVIAVVIKFVGVQWINKLMPPVVIGPTVALIGLSLAGAAVNDLNTAPAGGSQYVAIVCGLVTLAVVMLCSVFGKKTIKMIPFIIGILAGYLAATIFTLIGMATGNDALLVIDFGKFANMQWVPDFAFVTAFKGLSDIDASYIATIAVAYVPVAFVVFAEHVADHKNLSTIIDADLLEEPGLHRTLLGDGVGSMAGAFFGGCPNTTYGESVGCVAITRNASVATITTTAIMAVLISFLSPFVAFLDSIPGCVMGGVCITLYGFIAVSGLKMFKDVDLNDSKNLFVVAAILIPGIGGLTLNFGVLEGGANTFVSPLIKISAIACALILGIITNLILKPSKAKKEEKKEEDVA